MRYQELLEQLGDHLARVLAGLWADVEAGRITVDEFTELAVQLVEISNARGRVAAEAAFRSWAEQVTAQPEGVAITATPRTAEAERLTKAVNTITNATASVDTVMQLERLARNEPVQAATDAMTEAMSGSELVSGWRRGLEPGACQLCVWWWREGRVWRANHPMPRHTGCTCTQIPVHNERTANYQEGTAA